MKDLNEHFNPMPHTVQVVYQLLKLLKVPVTKTTLRKDLTEHPDFPSLLSISDVLKGYGVNNMAVRLGMERFDELPLPFLAYVKDSQSHQDSFVIVNKVEENRINILKPEIQKSSGISKEAFDKNYKGMLLAVEAAENAGEKDYHKNVVDERGKNRMITIAVLLLPLVSLLVLLNGWIAGTISPAATVYLLLALAGLLVSAALIWFEVDEYNPIARQVCQGGAKVNCSAVLNSGASIIMGISWAGIGAIYFLGMILSLLTGGVSHPVTLFDWAVLSLLALGYTVFSLYYQGIVLKQWCTMCLAVQGIFVLQAVTVLAGGFLSAKLNFIELLSSLLTIVSVLAVAFIVIHLLVPLLKKGKQAQSSSMELQRLKHNPQIFEALLAKQKKVEADPWGLGILLGKPEAKYRIIKVCNPYCGPCAKAHPAIEELLHNNSEVNVQIIFTATEDEKDYRNKPVAHLLAIQQMEQAKIPQALDDWYLADQKDYEVFAAKYPMNGELNKQNNKIKAMHDWCDATGIAFTPTFFVNGYQLPEMYSVSDLKYFLTA